MHATIETAGCDIIMLYPATCQLCNVGVANDNEYQQHLTSRRHVKLSGGGFEHACPVCNMAFVDAAACNAHMASKGNDATHVSGTIVLDAVARFSLLDPKTQGMLLRVYDAMR